MTRSPATIGPCSAANLGGASTPFLTKQPSFHSGQTGRAQPLSVQNHTSQKQHHRHVDSCARRSADSFGAQGSATVVSFLPVSTAESQLKQQERHKISNSRQALPCAANTIWPTLQRELFQWDEDHRLLQELVSHVEHNGGTQCVCSRLPLCLQQCLPVRVHLHSTSITNTA